MPALRRPAAPRPRHGWALVVTAAVLASGEAAAHPQYSPTRSNRYLKLALSGGGTARLVWSLMVGEAPALEIRRQADANGDGSVDEGELSGYAERLAAAVRAGLSVEVDGRRAAVTWEPPIVGLSDRRVGPLPFAVDVGGRVDFGPGVSHQARLEDRTAVDALGESELRIEEGPGTKVVAAWQARDDGGRQLRFVWSGPAERGEDRSVGLRFIDERAAQRSRRRPPLALLGALLGAGVAALAARRWAPRRRRPSARAGR